MKIIESTRFGAIVVGGATFDHDILIRPSGEIVKRKKKLSKEKYGTSHTVSEEEARFILQEGGEVLVLGTGQYGQLHLSPEAEACFRQAGCQVVARATPTAIQVFNEEKSQNKIGLFHVTC